MMDETITMSDSERERLALFFVKRAELINTRNELVKEIDEKKKILQEMRAQRRAKDRSDVEQLAQALDEPEIMRPRYARSERPAFRLRSRLQLNPRPR